MQLCPVCGLEPSDSEPGVDTVECRAKGCGVSLRRDGDAMEVLSLKLASDYSYLVLPMGSELDFPALTARFENSPAWRARVFTQDDPEDLERTGYFLPYIRQFLFPSLYGAEHQGEVPSAYFDYDLANLNPDTSPEPVDLEFEGMHSRSELPIRASIQLTRVSVHLFSVGAGFLMLRFRSRPGSTFFDQMGVLGHLRLISPLYLGYEMPTLRMGAQRFTTPQLVNFLLGVLHREPHTASRPAEIPADQPLPVRLIYDDRMMVYSFSCIEAESALADGIKVDRFFRRETPLPVRSPRPSEASLAKRAWLYDRWEGYSKDGAIQIAFDKDDFNRKFLGLYGETYYFDIFVLACLQRIVLLLMFENLSDIPALTQQGARSRRKVQAIQRDLLRFKNQCWFSQITNRERGLELWKRWQEVFESQTLLDEVNEQSSELEHFLQSQTRERVEWIMRVGAFLAATIPIVLALDQLLGDAPWVVAAKTWGLLALVAGSGVFGLFMLARKGRE